MKITIVGAGAVGASCAEYIAIKDFASEVVILDIKEGFAEGKAMDLMQTASLNGFDTKIVGVTNDYSKTAESDIVVITSGIPRKPGMTREELIGINAGIVKTVSSNLIEHSPNTITKVGGGTLTKLLGTSAWYAPGAAVSGLVQSIACDQKKMFPCSILLEGEYGFNDICIGVPVILGRNGIESVVELELTDAEKEHMSRSAEGVRKTNGLLAF